MNRTKQWIEAALNKPDDTDACLRAALVSLDDFRTQVEAMRDEAQEGLNMMPDKLQGSRAIANTAKWAECRDTCNVILDLIDAEQNPLEEK